LEYVNLCLPHLLASFIHLSQFRLIKESGERDPVSQSINFMLEHLTRKLKLEEIAKGVEKKMKVNKIVACPSCKG